MFGREISDAEHAATKRRNVINYNQTNHVKSYGSEGMRTVQKAREVCNSEFDGSVLAFFICNENRLENEKGKRGDCDKPELTFCGSAV